MQHAPVSQRAASRFLLEPSGPQPCPLLEWRLDERDGRRGDNDEHTAQTVEDRAPASVTGPPEDAPSRAEIRRPNLSPGHAAARHARWLQHELLPPDLASPLRSARSAPAGAAPL